MSITNKQMNDLQHFIRYRVSIDMDFIPYQSIIVSFSHMLPNQTTVKVGLVNYPTFIYEKPNFYFRDKKSILEEIKQEFGVLKLLGEI